MSALAHEAERVEAQQPSPLVLEVMSLVERYVVARIMENASVPTRSQRGNEFCEASHERARRESERAESDTRRALAELVAAHSKVADPSTCAAASPEGGYNCELPKGHRGEHRKFGGAEVTWPERGYSPGITATGSNPSRGGAA
jgi:hypothetical protein